MPYLSFFALLYFGACAYLYFTQRSILYEPTPQIDTAGAENISVQSDGEMLRIWHLGPADGDAIIYFGGNAEDVSEVIPEFARHFPHNAVYLVNYRGYGGSSGTPSEAGLFKDALTVYDFVHARHNTISLIGRSLGSGVAVYLETNRAIKQMVLTTPYDSIENVARKQFPMFPIALLLKDKFASDSRAASIAIPTMIILADADEVIPRANSEALIAAFQKSIPLRRIVPESTHNTILASAAYWQDVGEFLR
jgi:fermentation-respiration switch protein FrsA (DUF1100 family)